MTINIDFGALEDLLEEAQTAANSASREASIAESKVDDALSAMDDIKNEIEEMEEGANAVIEGLRDQVEELESQKAKQAFQNLHLRERIEELEEEVKERNLSRESINRLVAFIGSLSRAERNEIADRTTNKTSSGYQTQQHEDDANQVLDEKHAAQIADMTSDAQVN